jgi:hypothetical protein
LVLADEPNEDSFLTMAEVEPQVSRRDTLLAVSTSSSQCDGNVTSD